MNLTEGMSQLKNILKDLRKEYGYSQDGLAEKLGVSRQTVISIEKGKYNPSLPLALLISQIFNTTVERIFFLEEDDLKK
ncbi:helix-turn-helix transcriptional regulator [Lentibacillus juripiscarius]|uniref:Helix-turn-helix transcriptional regulator n=1 Tax=Lentibacillus juripiscarius TaxID=257446 RepID=A0ABW5V882_9BACI